MAIRKSTATTELVPMQEQLWVIQHCLVCTTVAIRVQAGEQEMKPVCKWCTADATKLAVVLP